MSYTNYEEYLIAAKKYRDHVNSTTEYNEKTKAQRRILKHEMAEAYARYKGYNYKKKTHQAHQNQQPFQPCKSIKLIDKYFKKNYPINNNKSIEKLFMKCIKKGFSRQQIDNLYYIYIKKKFTCKQLQQFIDPMEKTCHEITRSEQLVYIWASEVFSEEGVENRVKKFLES